MTKDERIGKRRKTLQGMHTVVLKYINRDKVLVRVLETKENIWTDWKTFNKGLLRVDTRKLHSHTDCTLNQAKFYIISIILLTILGIGALVYLFI